LPTQARSPSLETSLRLAGSLIGSALLEVRYGICLAAPGYRLQHGPQLRFSFQCALAVSLQLFDAFSLDSNI
jgi:hypothetical protein